MLGKVLALSSLSAIVILSALMQTTSPSTIHPAGILLIFVLIYVSALGVLAFFIYGTFYVLARMRKTPARSEGMSLTRAYYYASVLALAPVVLIGARSIGRTGMLDLILLAIFEVLACFYISKRN